MTRKIVLVTGMTAAVIVCCLGVNSNSAARGALGGLNPPHAAENTDNRELSPDPVPAAGKNHFGVDGLSARYLPVITGIGDGASGINGLKWSAIEPKPAINGQHTYNTPHPELVTALRKSGRSLQLNILSDSDWAMQASNIGRRDPTSGEKSLRWERIKPEYLDDWQALIRHLINAYDISFLQIGSEAENSWADVDGYIESVCAARQAAQGSGVLILAAGFNFGKYPALTETMRSEIARNAGPAELKALAAADEMMKRKLEFAAEFLRKGKDCFDVLTLHLNDGYESIPATVAWARQEMRKNGYTKPVWSDDMSSGPFFNGLLATKAEIGFKKRVEQGDPAALRDYEALQAAHAVKKIVAAFAAGVERVFLSSDVDWSNYHIPLWRHQGLLSDRGVRKPVFYNYQLLVKKLDGFARAEKLQDGVYKFSFDHHNPVFVAWTEGAPSTIDFSRFGVSGNVTVTRIVTALDKKSNPVLAPVTRVPASAVPVTDAPVFAE